MSYVNICNYTCPILCIFTTLSKEIIVLKLSGSRYFSGCTSLIEMYGENVLIISENLQGKIQEQKFSAHC
jgi:hypothetical protein